MYPKPILSGSFKEIYNIVKVHSHKKTAIINGENTYIGYQVGLDKIFHDEILINLQELGYDEKKNTFYFSFLKNKFHDFFKNEFDDRYNYLKNHQPTESVKNDLKNDFFSLEQSFFFEKETLKRKKIDGEKDPYSRGLTQDEIVFFEMIFNNYYQDWCSELKNYLLMYENLKDVYCKYIPIVNEPNFPITPPFITKEKVIEGIILNATNDLPIYVFFLGKLNLYTK